ncbi:hypothetical protein [Tepidibacter formicigenes]|jgi:signal recognition particle GTPase|uniref:Uncharacterized protein n=1 Tax=Tepidibacter formicigenes DSM 15518 TaxID=1123349 RepID=A0A1M6NRP2_9FIRM|nr:hypothetical protein [Tepidibacter formicigenes]SHJ98369.1 hypothetical protein SAMN02744037_01342 [Tepidibacter formicigenes DSM 15518]
MKFIIGTILFGASFTFIFLWGYKRSQYLPHDWQTKLLKKSKNRILKAFEKNKRLSHNEINNICKSIKIKTIKGFLNIKNIEKFTSTLMKNMVDEKLVITKIEKGERVYYKI